MTDSQKLDLILEKMDKFEGKVDRLEGRMDRLEDKIDGKVKLQDEQVIKLLVEAYKVAHFEIFEKSQKEKVFQKGKKMAKLIEIFIGSFMPALKK